MLWKKYLKYSVFIFLFIIFTIPCVSSDPTPTTFFLSKEERDIITFFELVILNYPINLLYLVSILIFLKRFEINFETSSKRIYFGFLGSVMLCTLFGAMIDLIFLYDGNTNIKFDLLNWLFAAALIIVLFYMSLLILSKNIKLSLLASFSMGFLNFAVWLLFLLSYNKGVIYMIWIVIIGIMITGYVLSPFMLRRYFSSIQSKREATG